MEKRLVMILVRQQVGGKWQSVDSEEGVFHAFGADYEDMGEHPPGNYSVAIVEMPDGTMKMPRADMVRFLDVVETRQ